MASKIAVLTSAHPAMDPRIFLKECRSLADGGYEITLIVPHDRDEIREGIQIKAIPRPAGRTRRFTTTLWNLYKEAIKQRADFYHLHEPELLLVGLALKLRTGARIIFDAHEDFTAVALRREWIPKLLSPIVRGGSRLFFRCLLPCCDAVVAATEAIANELPHRERVVVKNYSQLAPEMPGNAHEPNLLVYAGVVSEERGISLFLEAFRRIHRVIPARLRLIGHPDGPALVERIIEGCPKGSVEVLGWRPQEEALRLAANGTLGLALDLPHLGTDGPPTKMFDYMALGLPVVACELPTARQIIDETGCGIVVDLRDTQSVAAGIVDLLKNPARLEEMRQRGLDAFRNYRWDSQAEKLLRLYRKLEATRRRVWRRENMSQMKAN